jgi:hypothetical protein
MKTTAILAALGAILAGWALFSRGKPAARVRRAAADVALVALSLGLCALFLWRNGFIGNGDIQPYPY